MSLDREGPAPEERGVKKDDPAHPVGNSDDTNCRVRADLPAAKPDNYAQQDSARLRALFAGAETHHGTYDAARIGDAARGSKVEIKGARVRTVKEPPTPALWLGHLEGAYPLGVSPLRSDGTCLWGAIDVDSYDLSFSDIYNKVEKENLPLVICRSKSGGAHLFLFLAEPQSAARVRAALQKMAARLGHAEAEVFPKQDRNGDG